MSSKENVRTGRHKKVEQQTVKELLKFHPDRCHVIYQVRIKNTGYTHPDGGKDMGVSVDSDMPFNGHLTSRVNLRPNENIFHLS